MTSEKMKPTQGPWVAKSHNNETVQANDDWTVYGPNDERICMEGNGLPEDCANASLIAEAGTVFHECGLSPRELLVAAQELYESLRETAEALEHLENRMALRVNPPTLDNARAALAKHKEV